MSKQSDIVKVSQGADGDPLFIDTANNRVGVGTSSPEGSLDIAVGSGDIVSNLDGSPMITYRNGSGSWFHAGKHPSDNAFIFTTGATSTTTEHMRIDSAGRVTKPYQPAFSVAGTYSGGIGSGTKFAFSSTPGGNNTQIVFDRTSSWSNANNRYTAPVSGVYQFNFSIYTQGVTSIFQSIAVLHNGSQLTQGDAFIFFRSATGEAGNADNQTSGSFVMNLATNDYVEIAVRSGAPTFTTYGGHSNFSGFLVG